MKKKSRQRRKSSKSSLKKKIFINIFCITIFFIFVAFVGLAYLAHDLPDIEELAVKNPQPQINIYNSTGVLLAKYGDFRGSPLTYSNIPIHMINAVIASEDRRFFEHFGLDIIGIMRAYIANMRAGKFVQGGSTITQQLAKIIYLNPKKNLKRKLQEAIIAIQLELRFSKEQILTLYLNRIYLGKGNYGIDAAAKHYFDKGASEMTLSECAMLAGVLKAPSKYSPSKNLVLSVQNTKQILKLMYEQGFISLQEYKHVLPPVIIDRGVRRGALKNPYFADYVLSEAHELLEDTHLNLDIYTTLDLEAQNTLENAIAKYINKAVTEYKSNQVASIVMQPNGAIKAMIGGKSYQDSEYNRAVVAKRQPGSAFKLFVYAAAIENNINPYDIFVDEPISIALSKNRMWTPKNFDRIYHGSMTMIDAFAKSVNTIAARICEQVGRKKVIEMAKRLGIESTIPNIPSIALGTPEVSLLEITTAYAHIANNGQRIKPFSILKILNANKVIYVHPAVPKEIVLSREVVDKMKQLLKAVVDYGNGRRAGNVNADVYGKTGTTQDFRDAWFIGFTQNLVMSVWMGNDDNSKTKALVGGNLPSQIFKTFFEQIKPVEQTIIKEINSVFDVADT